MPSGVALEKMLAGYEQGLGIVGVPAGYGSEPPRCRGKDAVCSMLWHPQRDCCIAKETGTLRLPTLAAVVGIRGRVHAGVIACVGCCRRAFTLATDAL
jgi:hypothetical protein